MVSPSESILGLMSRMIEQNIGAVIVVDQDQPIGIITERNLVERVLVQKKNVYQTQAKDVMSTPLVSIGSDRTIKEALDLMRQHRIRRLAVMENHALVGLVTERRLLTSFLNQVY
jgi:CBS domain-containing protein